MLSRAMPALWHPSCMHIETMRKAIITFIAAALLALAAAPLHAASPSAYVEGELLVKFREGAGAVARGKAHASLKAGRLKRFERIGVDHVKLPPGMDLGLSQDMFQSFLEYQKLIDEQFAKMAEAHDFEIIDASRPVFAIQKELRKKLKPVLKGTD